MSATPNPLLPREEPVRLLDPAGTILTDPEYALPEPERLLAGYRHLVTGRRVNDQCNALVRQGRLAVYPSSTGQEACQVAAVLSLADHDWIFPTYRESVTLIARGVPAGATMTMLRGGWHGGYDPAAYCVAPQTIALATQLLHAVGFAHAATLRGEDTVVLAMCGDGATSEGDFHEAMNFAAVFHLPVVFFVQNNEFAISVPLSRQTAAESLAHKGVGYGMPGERVDGNDLPAVVAVLDAAVERARSGGGPSIIEAHTYRMEAHTNADDDARYRGRDEIEAWKERDPLVRMRNLLTADGTLTPELEAEFAEQADAVAAELRRELNAEFDGDPEDLFRYVYAERTPQLAEQWEGLREELARTEPAHSDTPGGTK
jgi:pyruvate dehydrogenase E1 component alpha subunit